MDKNKKLLFILGTCVLFGVFFLLLLVPYTSSGQILNKSQVISGNGHVVDVEFPYLQPLGTENPVTFQFHFPDSVGDSLVIRRPSGNALEVFLNGEIIYKLGNMNSPTSNIWNSILTVPLLHDLKPDNVLDIKISGGSYGIGLSVPPYITDFQTASRKAGMARFLYHDLLYVSIGAALIVGFILLLLSGSHEPKYQADFFFGLAAILAAIFCFDYVFRETSGSPVAFLWMKKVMMASGYLGTLFFLIGMEKYSIHGIKFGKIMIYATSVCVLLTMTAWNMQTLVKLLPFLNIFLLINLTGTTVAILRKQYLRNWMIIPAVLLALSLIQLIIFTALNLSLPFVLQYVVLVSALVFGISMINEYNQLYRENFELEQKANRDPMTGVYNRNILYKITPHPHDVLVILDIDNLKLFNDQFGHPEGDRLLISLMETVSSNLRQADLVIRYGGDEFILILRDASLEVAERIMKRINNEFSQKKSLDRVSFSYGIDLVGESFSETLARADEILYSMKKEGKENSTLIEGGVLSQQR